MSDVDLICGRSERLVAFGVGCGLPIRIPGELYRCATCDVPMHKSCLVRHFNTWALMPTHSERLIVANEALREALSWALDVLDITLERLDAIDGADLSDDHYRIRAAGLAKARAALELEA